MLAATVADGFDAHTLTARRVTEHALLTLVAKHVEQRATRSGTVLLVALAVVETDGALLAVTLGDNLRATAVVAGDGSGDGEHQLLPQFLAMSAANRIADGMMMSKDTKASMLCIRTTEYRAQDDGMPYRSESAPWRSTDAVRALRH
jgi:hypothetical protein